MAIKTFPSTDNPAAVFKVTLYSVFARGAEGIPVISQLLLEIMRLAGRAGEIVQSLTVEPPALIAGVIFNC